MKNIILCILKKVDDTIEVSSANLIDDGIIDSVALVEIAVELMDVFKIQIPYEEIHPENFNSVEAIVRLVEKYV